MKKLHFAKIINFEWIGLQSKISQSGGNAKGGWTGENLLSSTKTEYKMKCGFFLDVVVAQSATIF